MSASHFLEQASKFILTIYECVEDDFSVFLDEIVNISKDSAHGL